MYPLYSALATSPGLKLVGLSFGRRQAWSEHESALANPESLTEALRVFSLRFVCFHRFSFTPTRWQATASALVEGTAVTKLAYRECSFSAGDCAAIMATGLSGKTSVISIFIVQCSNARVLLDALAAAIQSDFTLRHVKLRRNDSDNSDGLSAILLASGKNTGLNTLSVDVGNSMNESLSTAMKDGLNRIQMNDDSADLWWKAFSFLRTNKGLKSLVVSVRDGDTESCLSAFCVGIAAMLQESASFESLAIQSWKRIKIKAEEYVVLVTAFQHNTTLRTLRLCRNRSVHLNDDENIQMASLLKQNYGLEKFSRY
jgi:hypothetical protein